MAIKLNSSYQFVGRSNAVSSPGGVNYYILLYAKTSPDPETGDHFVSVKMRLACTDAYSFWGMSTTGSASVDKDAVISWSGMPVPIKSWGAGSSITENGVTYPRWVDLFEGYAWVNTEIGVDKTVTISASWVANEANSNYWSPNVGDYAKASISVVLPAISAATNLVSLSCSTNYFDGSMTYKFLPVSANCYNRCDISLNRNGNQVAIKSIELGLLNSATQTRYVTLSQSELATIYNALPSTDHGVLRFTMRTYTDENYSTLTGDVSYKELQLYIPQNENTLPTMEMVVESRLSEELDDYYYEGLYLQGKSRVGCDLSGSGKYGASVVSYAMTVEGKSYTSSSRHLLSDWLTQAGTLTVTGTVTDSRGFVGTETVEIFVFPFTKPKVSVIVCARCNSNGDLNDSGTYLKIQAKRVYNKIVNNGVVVNACSIRYRYKPSDGDYSSWVTILSENSTSDEVNTVQSIALAVDTTYLVQVGVIDSTGENSHTTVTIPTDKVYWHRDGSRRSFTFGGYVEEDNTFAITDDIVFVPKGGIGKLSTYDGLDFDSLIYRTGYYASTATPMAAGCINYPVNKVGVLEVISHRVQDEAEDWTEYAWQTYRTRDGEIYTRSYYSFNGWSDWMSLSMQRA